MLSEASDLLIDFLTKGRTVYALRFLILVANYVASALAQFSIFTYFGILFNVD